jgi:uncharacterized phage protein (TIGR01671 family)
MNKGFRVYDKKEKRMITEPSNEGIFLSSNGNLINHENFAIYLMDRYVRMDSTGLLDKRNKEIYEGDIFDGVYGGGYIGWCDKCCSFEFISSVFGCMACSGDVHWFEVVDEVTNVECVVIGNMYEKPELLDK